jgi:hypothetical protein
LTVSLVLKPHLSTHKHRPTLLVLNAELAKTWPIITDASDPLEDTEGLNDKEGKLELLEK